MHIVLNGAPREIEAGATIAALLDEMGIETRAVAVEVNLDVVPRARHADCTLQEGDRVEVVTLVGGG
jgi:sulfur carrier protein